ncbi:DUF5132 domain-containing protein, partial [Nostoc sp. XA010]|nr:DUF5132 domain-containing protein [Nostoc sp. XA010]MCC5662194.1 DUF5132 domain-containing protein [Nostoc sp. XA010]
EDMVAEARAELADEKETPVFEASATNGDNVTDNGV